MESSNDLAKPILEALGVWQERIVKASINFEVDKPVYIHLELKAKDESESLSDNLKTFKISSEELR